MRRIILTVICLIPALLLAAGCLHETRRGEPIGRAVVIDSHAAARGEVVYMRHCYQCHQTGEGGLGPAIPNVPIPKPIVRLQVRAGLGKMPAFPPSEISEQQFDDLYAYLRARVRS